MCRPTEIKDDIVNIRTNREQQHGSAKNALATITVVTVVFIGGYGLGINNLETRFAILVGASGLLFFAFVINLNTIRSNPLFQWISQKASFSSRSSGSMTSRSSENTLSTLSRVTSVKAIRNMSKNLLSTLDYTGRLRSALQCITRKECFARIDYIERLSIKEISILFRYAAQTNIDDFDKNEFLNGQSIILQAVIHAIDMAVKVSRGSQTDEAKRISKTDRSDGDMDALYFVAVARIFAEWRTIRLVPKGYQRYTLGLTLAYRDVLQNLEKIERGVHIYLSHHHKANPDMRTPSPTLRQLLQFEATSNVHKSLPKVDPKSAASGILWTNRQLDYQTALMRNSLEVPLSYATLADAARAAYHLVYDKYHGWTVKQLFTHTFGGPPPMSKIWLTICPPTTLPKNYAGGKQNYRSKAPNSDKSNGAPSLHQLSDTSSATASRVSSSDLLETLEDENEVIVALDNFRHGIITKWEDLVRMFNCGKDEKKKLKDGLILSCESHFNLNQFDTEMVEASFRSTASNDASEKKKSVVMDSTTASSSSGSSTLSVSDQKRIKIESVKRDVEYFVGDISPMIVGIVSLMEELNMNDPTKV